MTCRTAANTAWGGSAEAQQVQIFGRPTQIGGPDAEQHRALQNETNLSAQGDFDRRYTTNVLNQYEQGRVADEPDMALLPQYDEDGNLTRLGAAGDLDCDGDVDFFDIDAWDEALEGQEAFEAAYPGCNWYAADLDGDGDVDEDDQALFLHRLGVSVMTASYVWDADNRLAAVVPDRLTTGARKLVFAYDYQGRRVCKSVYTYDAGWNLSSDMAFVGRRRRGERARALLAAWRGNRVTASHCSWSWT